MDGTYYFTAEDCNALAVNNPSVQCADAGMISTFDYQVLFGDLTASKQESAGSAAATTNVTYTAIPMMTGSYYNPTIDGDIAAQTDVHKFTITPPANTKVDPSARSRAYYWVQSYGSGDGTGTALDVVVTATDMSGNVLAKADQQYYTNGDDPTNNSLEFSFPLDDQFNNKLGSTYNISVAVSNKTGITPTKNYDIFDHVGGPFWYGQPEKEGPAGSAMNDTGATAETLTPPTGVTGGYFIDGNLSSPSDVDWFTFTVPCRRHASPASTATPRATAPASSASPPSCSATWPARRASRQARPRGGPRQGGPERRRRRLQDHGRRDPLPQDHGLSGTSATGKGTRRHCSFGAQ